MVCRVRENRPHLFDGQPEIRRDVKFIDTSFPILDNVIRWHTDALQHWTAALHAGPHFNERAI